MDCCHEPREVQVALGDDQVVLVGTIADGHALTSDHSVGWEVSGHVDARVVDLCLGGLVLEPCAELVGYLL